VFRCAQASYRNPIDQRRIIVTGAGLVDPSRYRPPTPMRFQPPHRDQPPRTGIRRLPRPQWRPQSGLGEIPSVEKSWRQLGASPIKPAGHLPRAQFAQVRKGRGPA
jgi:hypothetical protein